MPPGQENEIWVVLNQNPKTPAAVVTVPSEDEQVSTESPSVLRRAVDLCWPLLRDAIAISFWTYAIGELFFVDIYALALGTDAHSLRFVAIYRLLPLAVLTGALSAFAWRWKTLGFTLYVIFFPLILILWKVPKLFYRTKLHRNFLAIMAVLNSAILLVENFRYHAISKSITIVAVVAIAFGSPQVRLGGACIVLALLIWATMRVVLQTFRQKTFVVSQNKLIALIAKYTDAPLQLRLVPGADGVIPQEKIGELANSIQTSALANRLLYLWAFKLQQYRESRFLLVFNGIAYFSFLIGATFAFFLLNWALLHAMPEQYTFIGSPSPIALYQYAISSLAFADGGGIAPKGDVALSIRILAELFGPGFLLAIVVNSVFVLRDSRDDSDLRRTVSELRRRARNHEERFKETLSVGIDEACERLLQLGRGDIMAFLNWVRDALPPDYLAEDE